MKPHETEEQRKKRLRVEGGAARRRLDRKASGGSVREKFAITNHPVRPTVEEPGPMTAYAARARGGRTEGAADERAEMNADKASDAAMIRKAMAEHDRQLHGGEHTKLKLARGGGMGWVDGQPAKSGGAPKFRTPSGSVSAGARRSAESHGEAMPGGRFPIRNTSDLSNAKHAFGRANNKPAVRKWIDKRARDLGKPPMGGS